MRRRRFVQNLFGTSLGCGLADGLASFSDDRPLLSAERDSKFSPNSTSTPTTLCAYSTATREWTLRPEILDRDEPRPAWLELPEDPVDGDAAANEAIERYRKRRLRVTVCDEHGNPLAEQRVRIRQTSSDFRFGCNIFPWGHLPDARQTDYTERFAKVFNAATVAFYWWMYEAQQGKPQDAYTEQVARWCQANGICVKGHPLFWNHAEPTWLPDDPQTLHTLALERITQCVTRFRGLIDSWDVINEATNCDTEELRQNAPKLTRLLTTFGAETLVRETFQTARTAHPGAELLVNDYRVDDDYARRVITPLLAAELAGGVEVVPAGRLLDAIGLQSHQHTSESRWSNAKIVEVCRRFSSFGRPLHFTETTIPSGRLDGLLNYRGRNSWQTSREEEERQSREVVRFYQSLFAQPSVDAIFWWDFSDHGAWLNAPAGWLRADMSPKPIFDAMLELLGKTWRTELEATTDLHGQVAFRGFVGTYRVQRIDG